jgi:hypothetical protein
MKVMSGISDVDEIGSIENISFAGKKGGISAFLSFFRRFLLFFLFDKIKIFGLNTIYSMFVYKKHTIYCFFMADMVR